MQISLVVGIISLVLAVLLFILFIISEYSEKRKKNNFSTKYQDFIFLLFWLFVAIFSICLFINLGYINKIVWHNITIILKV